MTKKKMQKLVEEMLSKPLSERDKKALERLVYGTSN